MRQFILSICLLNSILSIAQRSAGIMVPKDDASPFSWQTKHLWVGKNNLITSNYVGDFQLLKVWTDNGTVDTGDFYLTNHSIKPARTGIVKVYAIQKVWKGKVYDTIQTETTFKAIIPPRITVILKSDNYNKDTTLSLDLVDSLSLRPISKRYKIDRFFDPQVFDHKDNLIGVLTMCSGTVININSPIHNSSKIKFEKGYKIKISITIRDMKTDLLILTDELVYTIR